MSQLQTEAILFLDFDGTITERDAVDAILEAYADSEWLELEADWRAGRLGSRECLKSQMVLVRASRKELDSLLDKIEIDEGLTSLLEFCATHSIATHIISDGFDYCIRRILSRVNERSHSLLRGTRICASRLEVRGKLWRTWFPFFQQTCAHGCATCKPAVMRLLNPENAVAIFVGDGLSDRYAVQSADLVLAKNGLAKHCDENSIEYFPFTDLSEVAKQLEHWLVAHLFKEDEIEKKRASA